MGKEIRKVPENYTHPFRDYGRGMEPAKMYDENFSDAVIEWKKGYSEWEMGIHPDQLKDTEYFEVFPVPNRLYYRDWKNEDAIWFQVWETISEGTPITPAFPNLKELCEYLAFKGDFWTQKAEKENNQYMPKGPWGIKSAENFIKCGSIPSFIIEKKEEEIRILNSNEIF